MARLTNWTGCLLVVSLVGCGGGGSNTTGDMAMVETVDLAMPPAPKDFMVLAPTGAPCKASADCAKGMAPGNNAATCTKSNMLGGHATTWPDGYCQSPCRPTKNDANGINNTDCSGDTPVCAGSGTTGTCYAACTGVSDCRDDYVCANITGTPSAACVPLAASSCDPVGDPRPGMKSCPMGQRCVAYSQDKSYGGCADVCDPIAQDCPPAMSGANGCVVDFQVNDGSGECINVTDNQEGAPCVFLNSCPAGMMCYGQKCRNYCRVADVDAGGKACPMGQTCKDIALSGITVKFKKEKTGICSP